MAKVLKAHTAGMASTQRQRMEDARGHWKHKALFVGSMLSGLVPIPVVSTAGAAAIDHVRNNSIEEKQLEVLTDTYRTQVAIRLGIKPENVNVKDLKLAAQVDPTIRQAIQKVTTEKKNANRANIMGSAGMAAVGFIPGVNSVTNTLGRVAIHGAGAMGGQAVSSVFDRPVLHVQDMVEEIDAKLVRGEKVKPADVVLLRISQDEAWQAAFKKKNGKAFHKLNEAEREEVVAAMPEMLMGAKASADGLNSNAISVQSLVMSGPASSTKFTDQIASQRNSSFLDAEERRRQAREAMTEHSIN